MCVHASKSSRRRENSDACRDEDYRHAMNELTGFSFTTKKLHDDAPDSLAMLADYLGNGIKNVSVARRPF